MKRLLAHKMIVFPVLGLVLGVGAWLAVGVFSIQTLFIDKVVSEAPPVAAIAGAPAERTGVFQSGAHKTTGTAILLAGPEGEPYLRFENFATSNGPDLKVYLRKAGTKEFTNLGSLKGNIGSQNYELTANVIASDFDTVDIWCDRFSVSFGTAKLSEVVNDQADIASAPLAGRAIGKAGGDTFPDVIAVVASVKSGQAFDVSATVSSKYDTPEGYADAFRVKTAEGTVLGTRDIAHDHQAEQPFTRSLYDVSIPDGVTSIIVEGRDQANGWGGQAWEIPLP